MTEKDPTPELYPFEKIKTVSGEYHELTRDNTTVFTHLGRQAIYGHIFVKPEEKDGVYLWRFSPTHGREVDLYHHIKPKAVDNDCQLFLNIREVNEKDVETYIKHATGDLKDVPPQFDTEEQE